VLVNDNATGLLTSIAEQPFTSVNASTTVATTSFGGYADAGTTITLTPHISEGDYLQLEYSVELSSFTGAANAATGSPPPRQTDRVESKVTIPDGATIIVGGLNRDTLNTTVNAIPIIGQIPVLGWLFSARNNMTETSTLFVFLRPTILRDEEFADLRNISEDDLKHADMPSNFPSSTPQVMR
jgi:general secretion pathway protein D